MDTKTSLNEKPKESYTVAKLNEEEEKKIKEIEDRMNVILIAYTKTEE